MSRYLVLLFCAGVLAFAPSAAAVDGVVLINQATSVNGLPGCPHAGFPIVICQSGSYRLAENLTVGATNTNAIDITVNNVSIDLNGFTVSGPGDCVAATYPVQCTNIGTGRGINGSGSKNLTVRNGTVRGFGAGVLAGPNALVDGVHAESNTDIKSAGIWIFDGLVIHCTTTANAGDGIDGSLGTISFSTASYNGANGISSGYTVSNN